MSKPVQRNGNDGLLESAGSEKSEKYIALYRSAVYVLSYLVGKMFCNYLKFSFDVELDLDKNLSGWSPNEAFQKSIDDIFENVSRENFGMENFKGRLIDLKGSASEPKVQIESPTGKTVFTSDDITYYIMGELSLQKETLEIMQMEKIKDSSPMKNWRKWQRKSSVSAAVTSSQWN